MSSFSGSFDLDHPEHIAFGVLSCPYLEWKPATRQRPEVSVQAKQHITNEVEIHRYQILGVLGQGGFGTVFRARSDEVGCVAIKIPRMREVDSSEWVLNKSNETRNSNRLEFFSRTLKFDSNHRMEATSITDFNIAHRKQQKAFVSRSRKLLNLNFIHRFQREVEMLQKVSSKYVVPVHLTGHVAVDGTNVACIVMKFVEGRKLDSVMKDEVVTEDNIETLLPQILIQAKQIALGVAAIHDHGSPHRDLSWNNVIVNSRTKDCVVVDLGNVLGDNRVLSNDLGFAIGTPGFVAPEQRNLDPELASDQFSLGVLLYYSLTADFPYSRDDYTPNSGSTDPKQLLDFFDINKLPENHLEAIRKLSSTISKCLDPKHEQRFSSMRDLAARIDLIHHCLCAPENLLIPEEITPSGRLLKDLESVMMTDLTHRLSGAAIVMIATSRQCRLLIEQLIVQFRLIVSEILNESYDIETLSKARSEIAEQVMQELREFSSSITKIAHSVEAQKDPTDSMGRAFLSLIVDFMRAVRSLMEKANIPNSEAWMSEWMPDSQDAKKHTHFLFDVRKFVGQLGLLDYKFACYISQLKKMTCDLHEDDNSGNNAMVP